MTTKGQCAKCNRTRTRHQLRPQRRNLTWVCANATSCRNAQKAATTPDPARPRYKYNGRIRKEDLRYHDNPQSDLYVFVDQYDRQCRMWAHDYWGTT